MVGLLRAELAQVKDANGVKSYGARNLDPRCRSSFYAIVHHADGPDERITSTGGRSGGAAGAYLIRIRRGAHLPARRRLTSEPSYTTLFLDEALIKPTAVTRSAPSRCCRASDSRSSSPPGKQDRRNPRVSTKAYVTYKDPDTGLTPCARPCCIRMTWTMNHRRIY